jgi:hypothetical protein
MSGTGKCSASLTRLGEYRFQRTDQARQEPGRRPGESPTASCKKSSSATILSPGTKSILYPNCCIAEHKENAGQDRPIGNGFPPGKPPIARASLRKYRLDPFP